MEKVKANLSINKSSNFVDEIMLIDINYTFHQKDIIDFIDNYKTKICNNINYFLKKYRIDELVMIGNTSRIPYFREIISNLYDNIKLVLDIDESIAKGNCLYGGHLALSNNKRNRVKIINYTQNPVEIIYNKTIIKLCESNTLYPFRRRIKINHMGDNNVNLIARYGKNLYNLGKFTINNQNQVTILINIYYGESGIINISEISSYNKNDKIKFIPWESPSASSIKDYECRLRDKINKNKIYLKMRNEVENIFYRVNNKFKSSTHPINKDIMDLFDNINSIFIDNLSVCSDKLVEIRDKLLEIEKKLI